MAAVSSGAASAPKARSGAASAAASDARGIVIRAGGAAGAASAPTAESVRLAEGESGLRLKAIGHYRKLPVRIDLRTAGVLGFFDDGGDAKSQPLSLRALIGRTDLAFDGATRNPLHFTGLKGRFRLSGPSLANVGDVLGITLPTTPAFKTHGTLVKDLDVWKAVFEYATIGSSRLNGAFTFDTPPEGPAPRRPPRRATPAPRRPRTDGRHGAAGQRASPRPRALGASFPTSTSTCRRCAR